MTPLKDLRMPHSFYFRLCMLKYIIATSATMSIAVFHKAKFSHNGSEVARLRVFLQVAIGYDLGRDFRQREELGTGILHLGRGVIDGDELLLAGGDHELLDVVLDGVDLFDFEPVVKSVLQEIECLGVHAVVGQLVGVGRVDGDDMKGQPAAVTGLVGQELLLVAAGGIAGHAHPFLLMSAEGGSHVDIGGGDHLLELVQLTVVHLVTRSLARCDVCQKLIKAALFFV